MKRLTIGLIILISAALPLKTYAQQSKIDTTFIDDTRISPHSAVCQLIVYRRSVKSLWLWKTRNQSTAFYIDTNLILTNAHNVYSSFWSKVISVEVHRGKVENSSPFGVDILNGGNVAERYIRVPEEYSFLKSAGKRARFDYAVVKVSSRQKVQEFLALKTAIPIAYEGKALATIGYPGETLNGKRQYLSKGKFLNSNQHNIYYQNVFTEKGNSGSPVITDNYGEKVVIGVHAFPNKAVKISSTVIQQIDQWKIELNHNHW